MSALVAYDKPPIIEEYKKFVNWYSTADFGKQIIAKLRTSTNNQFNNLITFWSIAQSMVDNIDWFTLIYVNHGIDENVLLGVLETMSMQRGGVKIKKIVNGVEVEVEVDEKKSSKLFRIIDATVALLTTVVAVGTAAVYLQQGVSTVQSIQAPVAAGAVLEFGRAFEDAEVIAAAFGYKIFNMSDTTQTDMLTTTTNTTDFLDDVCGQLDIITKTNTDTMLSVITQCPTFNMTCVQKVGGSLALDLVSSVVLSGSGAFEYVNAFDISVPPYGGNELLARSPDPGARFQFPLRISTGCPLGLLLQGKEVVDDATKNVTKAIDDKLVEYGVQNVDELIEKLEGGTNYIAGRLFNFIGQFTMKVSSTENVEKLKNLQCALVEFNKGSVYLQKVNPRLHMLLSTFLKENILGFPTDITKNLILSELEARTQIARKMTEIATDLPGRLSAAPTSALGAFGEAQQVVGKVGSKVNAAKVALGFGGGGGPSGEMFVVADVAANLNGPADADGGLDLVGNLGGIEFLEGGKKRRKSKKAHRKTQKKRRSATRRSR